MELQHYMNVFKRKWWIVALLILVGCSAAFFYSRYYIKPVFEASTDLIVNKPGETGTGQQQVDQNSINTNLMLINTYKQIIKSPVIMKQVIQMNPSLNLTVEELSSMLMINSMKDTQIITLSIQDYSYTRAASIVSAVSNVFRNQVTEIMKVNNVSVLTPADPLKPASPVNDNHLVLMIFSFLVMLLLGLGIVYLLDYLDDTVKTESDIEQVLGLTLLGNIPRMRNKDLSDSRTRTTEQANNPVLRPAKGQR